jgi:hypothetical protein
MFPQRGGGERFVRRDDGVRLMVVLLDVPYSSSIRV